MSDETDDEEYQNDDAESKSDDDNEEEDENDNFVRLPAATVLKAQIESIQRDIAFLKKQPEPDRMIGELEALLRALNGEKPPPQSSPRLKVEVAEEANGEESEQPVYEINAIMGYEVIDGVHKYHVEWVSCPPSWASTEEILSVATDAARYHIDHGKPAPKRLLRHLHKMLDSADAAAAIPVPAVNDGDDNDDDVDDKVDGRAKRVRYVEPHEPSREEIQSLIDDLGELDGSVDEDFIDADTNDDESDAVVVQSLPPRSSKQKGPAASE